METILNSNKLNKAEELVNNITNNTVAEIALNI